MERCVVGMMIALLGAILLSGCGISDGSGRAPRTLAPGAARPKGAIPDSAWRAEARKWLGAPYRYGGTDGKGFDCSGFTWHLYRTVAGVSLPRTSAAQFRVGQGVRNTQLRPGDLVFFQTTDQPISHVGVWLGGNQFAHASTRRGVIISSLGEPYYSKRFRGAKRPLP